VYGFCQHLFQLFLIQREIAQLTPKLEVLIWWLGVSVVAMVTFVYHEFEDYGKVDYLY